MRTKAMGVPRLAPLGSYVYYTHRASGCVGGHSFTDVGGVTRSWMYQQLGLTNERGHFSGKQLPAPQRKGAALTRWVVVWPAPGYGTVVGLTYRSEGRVHPGGVSSSLFGEPDYDQPYLEETDRYPLYEVRTSLTGLRMLVPPWALAPLPPPPASVGLWQDEPPAVIIDGKHDPGGWEAFVAAWVTPHPRAVVPA